MAISLFIKKIRGKVNKPAADRSSGLIIFFNNAIFIGRIGKSGLPNLRCVHTAAKTRRLTIQGLRISKVENR